MLYLRATAVSVSKLIRPTEIRFSYCFSIDSSAGARARQYPHHGAQNFTRTGFLVFNTSSRKLSVVIALIAISRSFPGVSRQFFCLLPIFCSPGLCSLQLCFLREQHNTGQNANARAQGHHNGELCNERTLTEQDAAQPSKHTARDRQNCDPQASTNDSLPGRCFCPSEFLIKSLSYLYFHFTSKRHSCQETAHKMPPDLPVQP